jgi:hypothetical protein
MNKNRKESRQSGQLEKKLAAYTFAGAAAFVAPGVAKADIVYVPNVNQTVNQGDVSDSLTFPFAGDITITASSTPGPTIPDPNNEISASVGSNAAVLMDGGIPNDVAALAFGSVIDPTNPTNWGSGGKLVGYDTIHPNDSGGPWSFTGGTNYLGFYFGAAGSPQAGWAEIATTANATTSSFELLSYAYETSPNVAIDAGQTAATPEPSALPLLVLGGAGLIALRRRRAANA